MDIKHVFQSAKGDGPDASLVRPSDWNAAHTFVVTGPALVGRPEAGEGPASEILLGDGLSFGGSGELKATITGIPVGTVVDFVGLAEPTGWLFCFGQQLSRDVYSDLFAIIGTSYGVGDGATTFNLPDFRGRVRAGKDNMGGTAANRIVQTVDGKTLGNVVGGEKHVLVVNDLPVHSHTGTTGNANTGHHHKVASNENVSDGSPTLGAENVIAKSNNSGGGTSYTFQSGSAAATLGKTSDDGTAHTHNFTTGNTGAGEGHMNMQPTIIVNTIIYYGATT